MGFISHGIATLKAVPSGAALFGSFRGSLLIHVVRRCRVIRLLGVKHGHGDRLAVTRDGKLHIRCQAVARRRLLLMEDISLTAV